MAESMFITSVSGPGSGMFAAVAESDGLLEQRLPTKLSPTESFGAPLMLPGCHPVSNERVPYDFADPRKAPF